MLHQRRSNLAQASTTMFTPGGDGTGGASRVGAELRTARQRLGWDLPDVAAALRIRLAYLEAIEDGRVADLPGSAYAVGFLRTYAAALGLDADEVSRRFRAEAQEVNRKTELSFPAPVPERGVPAMAVVLLGLIVAGGTYAAWYRLGTDRGTPRVETVQPVPERLAPLAERVAPPSNPSPQVASILPQPSPAPSQAPPNPAPPPPAPPGAAAAPRGATAVPLPPGTPGPALPVLATPNSTATQATPPQPEARIVVRAKTDSWVHVRERQGQVLLSRVLRSGETWPVPERQQLLLTTGNAGGTELVVDGKPGPSLGQAGALRRDVPLDPDALKQGRTTASAPAARPAVSTPQGEPQ